MSAVRGWASGTAPVAPVWRARYTVSVAIDLTQLSARDLGTLLRLGDERAVRYVTRALEATGGDVRAAAARLGLTHEVTLHRWLALPALAGAPRAGLAATRAGFRAHAAKTRGKTRGSVKTTEG